MIFVMAIILAGLIFSFLLFYRFPVLQDGTTAEQDMKISVVIPARNEEYNLPLLLEDLRHQTVKVHEVICVDDDSTDATAETALAFGVKLLRVKNKPEGWTGKTWACQTGAMEAEGEVLLFIDADVRLSPNAVKKLIITYKACGCTVSVQPYHTAKKAYEQLSLFFNLIQIAANGVSYLFKNKHSGLFGPVILISKEDFEAIGGYCCAKSSIVEDIALGKKLKTSGKEFSLFMGNEDISFRMYQGGIRVLLQGWIKNFATGAVSTPPVLLVMSFIWITSCASIPVYTLWSALNAEFGLLLVLGLLYIMWAAELWRITRRIGSFSFISVLLYPFLLLAFIIIFMYSAFMKILGCKVTWKDRKIELGK